MINLSAAVGWKDISCLRVNAPIEENTAFAPPGDLVPGERRTRRARAMLQRFEFLVNSFEELQGFTNFCLWCTVPPCHTPAR
jgi:hypothetical protein